MTKNKEVVKDPVSYWTPISENPKEPGQYRLRYKDGRIGIGFWVLKASGKRDWLIYGSEMPLYYQPCI